MADIALLLEAEQRGILPPDKAALLSEARARGLVPSPAAPAANNTASASSPMPAAGSGPDLTNLPPEEPSSLIRFGRGMMDVGQGIKQLYLMATNPDEAKKYTADKNEEISHYEAGRKQGGQEGMDWMRIGGNAVATAPALLTAAPATVAGRLGMAAAQGGAQGLVDFNPQGTVGSKAVQVGIGAGAGTVMQGAGEAVAPLAAKVVEKGAQAFKGAKNLATGAAFSGPAEQKVAQQLGPEVWNGLDAATQGRLVGNAMKVLASGRELDATALLRKSDIEALGAKPLEGQLTRDPKQWYWEQETAKLRGVGDPIQQSLADQNRVLMDQVPAMRPRGANADGYETAEGLRSAVDKYSTQAQKDVSSQYTTAAAQGADVPFDGATFMAKIKPIVETYEDKISSPVMKRIRELDAGLQMDAQGAVADATVPRAFTVDEATKLYKLINDSMGGEGGGVGRAASALNRALMETGTASTSTAPAMAGFRDATAAARERFKTLEPTPIKALADTTEAPVNFVETKILGGKPGEVAALRDVVQKQDPQAWDNVRGNVLEWLQKKATGNDAEGKFSGKRFGDALDKIGNARLKVLFSEAELAQLGTIRRASYAMTREPPFAGVNHSNSGSTLANLVNHSLVRPLGAALAHVPVVGPMAVGAYSVGKDAMQKAADTAAAKAAVNPGVSAVAAAPVSVDAVRKRIAALLMNYGGPVATSAALTKFGP